jgi:very-long-chain (3R)-3-hydroxyacyl-CoA dehydratase
MPPKSSSTSSSKPAPPPSSPIKNAYLIAYNALSAALWAGVLYKTVTIGSREVNAASKNGWFTSGEGPLGALQKGLGSGAVYDQLEEYTRLTQSLAGLEVLHSLFGTLIHPHIVFYTAMLRCEIALKESRLLMILQA